jgi:hypothetical protein
MTVRRRCTLAAVLAFAAGAAAQGEETLVAVTVSAANERSVYVDRGRDAGVVVGASVRFFVPGAGEVEGEVRAVSQSSARVDLPADAPVPPVGTNGEVRVVRSVTVPRAPATAPPRPVPAHPPWTRREEPRTADQPLLVPTFGQRPEQRPVDWSGRWFASGQWHTDRAGDHDSEAWLARTGVRADATNLLGRGERTRVAGELDARVLQIEGDDDRDDTTARLDLASLAFGTEAYAPTGVEVGRFFSPHLPELGLVDGVEVVRRYQDGVRLGAGFGALPRPFPARDTGEDLGVWAFADYVADAARSAAATVGALKSWHRGRADRDLVLLRGEWRPAGDVWALGSAKLDWHGGDDAIAGRGVALTEVMLQARWDGRELGTGLTASRFTWPELRRAEYQALPEELVRDGFVERLAWYGRWRPATSLTLRPRVDRWRDQERDGATWGVDGDWRGPWSDSSAVSLSAFVIDGGYASGPGARVALREQWGGVAWRASYRWFRYELTSLVSGPEEYTRQSLELGASCALGAAGDLDLTCERWFGDREDAFAVGVYLQWRF